MKEKKLPGVKENFPGIQNCGTNLSGYWYFKVMLWHQRTWPMGLAGPMISSGVGIYSFAMCVFTCYYFVFSHSISMGYWAIGEEKSQKTRAIFGFIKNGFVRGIKTEQTFRFSVFLFLSWLCLIWFILIFITPDYYWCIRDGKREDIGAKEMIWFSSKPIYSLYSLCPDAHYRGEYFRAKNDCAPGLANVIDYYLFSVSVLNLSAQTAMIIFNRDISTYLPLFR